MAIPIYSFLLILATANFAHPSPVLLWSNADLPLSPVALSAIAPNKLISDSICSLSTDKIQLHLLVVNSLTHQDIIRGSQRDHPVLIAAKNDTSKFRYFPSVAHDVYNTFFLIPQSNNMKCAHIKFELKSDKTYDTLLAALNELQETTDDISTDSKTIVVKALISRLDLVEHEARKRRAIGDDQGSVVVSEDGQCMLHSSALHWINNEGETTISRNYTLNSMSTCTISQNSSASGNISLATLNLVWSNGTNETVTTSLIASLAGRYWNLQSVKLNEIEYRYFAYGMYDSMETPPSFSYVCTKATFVRFNSTGKAKYDFKDQFYLTSLQFQPFNGGNGTLFGPPNYCTSFFTAGIWMGITSSLLCLAILLFGITRMLNIRSVDRFDDPKGKPLVIKTLD